ncbi:MAG TPA: histidine kinase [Clostridiales bacterium]|nr:histidine kinase [Clostridiales bacterium]
MKSIQKKLLIYISLVSVFPIIILGTVSYYVSSNALEKKINESSMSRLHQIVKNLENKNTKVENFLNMLSASSEIGNILRNYDQNTKPVDYYLAANKFRQTFLSFFYNDKSIDSGFILSNKGFTYEYNCYIEKNKSLKLLDWYDKTTENKVDNTWVSYIEKPNDIIKSFTKADDIILVGTNVRDINYASDLSVLGIACIFLNKSFFSSIYEGVDELPDTNTVIIDDKGNIVITSDKAAFYSQLDNISGYSFAKTVLENNKGLFRCQVNKSDLVVSYMTLNTNGWKVLQVTPYSYYIREITSIGWISILLAAICLCIIYLLAFFVSKSISRPLLNIVKMMDKVTNGDFQVTVPVTRNDEIGIICAGFNNMVKSIGELFSALKEEEREKRKAEIMKLQYQINPHFLYNTLASIRLMASLIKADEIARIIKILSRLLRNTISKADQLTTIYEEFANAMDYIEIQQIRYDNKIFVEKDIEKEILPLKIKGMLLQPILENSIMHGLAEKLNNGSKAAYLKISGYKKQNNIYFEVFDNGKGMTPEQIKNVFEKNDSLEGQIGVKNIHNRIRLLYGDEYGASIESVRGEWTKVVLSLPYENEEVDKYV